MTSSQVAGHRPVHSPTTPTGRLTRSPRGHRTTTLRLRRRRATWRASPTRSAADDRSSPTTPPGGSRARRCPDGDGDRLRLRRRRQPHHVTPPGPPAHTFTYTPGGPGRSLHAAGRSGRSRTGPGTPTTTTGGSTQVDRPDGTAVASATTAPAAWRTITEPSGTTTLTYDQTTGNLTAIAAPGGDHPDLRLRRQPADSIDRTGPLAGTVQPHLRQRPPPHLRERQRRQRHRLPVRPGQPADRRPVRSP